MKVNLSWVALTVAILFSTSAQAQNRIPVPTQNMPAYLQACMGQLATAREIFVYRAAGLTLEDVHISIGFALKVIKFHVKRGADLFRDIDELEASYRSMADEIYEIPEDDFNTPAFQQAWGKKTMRACMVKLKPEKPADPGYHRMIPDKSA